MLHGDHLVSHVTKPELREENVLHVIGVITNSHRIHSRLRLAREWLQRMVATPYVKVTLVEAAYGDRNHELKQICHELNVDFVPLRTHSCIWIKENMINIAYKHITVKYPGARYFAHIDCDVEFNCPSWALESLHG